MGEVVYAQAESLEKCRRQLLEVLEEWIFVRLSRKLPLPEVDGIKLPAQDSSIKRQLIIVLMQR